MKCHTLSEKYIKTKESNIKKRRKILEELLNNVGENVTLINPIYFHYGSHTTIGNYFFYHFNLIIQDDVWLCSNVKILLGVKLVKEVLLLKIYLVIL